eukprot:TRINITY_DN26110_c0_g1_i1.p1 TRINITY_DN26110_c0_g1~~TRINITY_DN26110_c0_g1_i1.p1  ORF type:complete len:709 (+),score=81.33 TRINITY_DN26110_c0_g1_i1:175-2301(+)
MDDQPADSSFCSENASPLTVTPKYQRSRTSSFGDQHKVYVPQGAWTVLRNLLPACVLTDEALRKEGVHSAFDLACLDKDDLRDLGLNMAQRSKVLRWARETFPSQAASVTSMSFSDANLMEDGTTTDAISQDQSLDALRGSASFWCSVAASAKPPVIRFRRQMLDSMHETDMNDFRENVLEVWFDLTQENLTLVFEQMIHHGKGKMSLDSFRLGLQSCGIDGLSNESMPPIIDKTASKLQPTVAELQVILSRLKLAQLLVFPLEGNTRDATSKRVFTVVDYNTQRSSISYVNSASSSLKDFFFGHRPRSTVPGVAPRVRWVHMHGYNVTGLLGLTVKYGLHPLGVEDTFLQCSTKLENYGCHFFAAVQVLSLAEAASGNEAVQVQGHHVAVFCAGPPSFDTVITTAQSDRDFQEDWPGAKESTCDDESECAAWLGKLKQRINTPRSRLRQLRGDFLLHQIIDLCNDELESVASAFARRLSNLEVQLLELGADLPEEILNEISLVQMQLGVLLRRFRGMQRLLRHAVDQQHLGEDFPGYFQDIKEEVQESIDDVLQLVDKCRMLVESYERVSEKKSADRISNTLFILTAATTIMSPVQFMAGVYGMNFQIDGVPTIPELGWRHGYLYFWVAVLVYLCLSIFAFFLLHRRWHRVNSSQHQLPRKVQRLRLQAPISNMPSSSRHLTVPLISASSSDAKMEFNVSGATQQAT